MNDLEKQLADALREHAMRTGGVIVGDTVTFGGYTVRVTGCVNGQLRFDFVNPPDGLDP